MNLSDLRAKWNENAEAYSRKEVGGVQDFVKDCFSCCELFNLKNTVEAKKQANTYAPEVKSPNGKVDFLVYINKDIIIPCEVKHRGTLSQGDSQLKRYQLDYTKQYGILTDGYEWRFYRSQSHRTFTLDYIFNNPKDFLTFWKSYLEPNNYYLDVFAPEGQGVLFDEPLDLNDAANRSIFFRDTTQIIRRFRTKINIRDEKTAVETAYAYLIQFILYKVLVDNRFQKFENEYKLFRQQIVEAIRSKNLYYLVVSKIRDISEYISKNIYKPFAQEQQAISEKLVAGLKRDLEIDDIAPWLDIIAFVNKYDFSNLQNEIFGFVYENYLKDLYGENKGQYFTNPDVVNFMLDELGYNEDWVKQNPDKISIIDPACGAGTFLYSAADKIIRALDTMGTKEQAAEIKSLIDRNIFGLDITEFSLYLAEMSILMGLLPLIVNDKFEQPVENKLKLFKTKDSIAEFVDTGISAQEQPLNLFTHLQETALDYQSFMRDDKNLTEMLLSMQGRNGQRLRFDFVAMNPPYIGYNECAKQKIEFVRKIQNPADKFNMGNVFGVNLNTVPGRHKKNTPKPNLYAFFIALGYALLKDGGKMAFIIPQNILQNRDLDVVRYLLSQTLTLDTLITFEANMFIGRGLSGQKTVPTSSLIFIASKKVPKANHKVRVINYKHFIEKNQGDFAQYLKNKNKTVKTVLQSELLEKIENWNFIKEDNLFARLLDEYQEHSFSIEEYRQNALKDYDDVCFDAGYFIDERTLSEMPEYYMFPNIEKRFYTIRSAKGYWAKDREIPLLRANQGHRLLSMKYKILWRYNNPDGFHWTDKNVISSRNKIYFIGNNDRYESLFTFAVINSQLNWFLLNKMLRVANEKSLLISLSGIKSYVRIPKITPKNQKLKERIVTKTDELLKLETFTLRDFVDFDEQTSIKKEIDDLVFALYFDVPVKNVAQHDSYRYVNS
ncbi:hypothetical protein FACS189419_07110 [Planctomycetales bacterium]|nr:hypothetical protein FACS189419_07110 [Planctomycetales bacterium]